MTWCGDFRIYTFNAGTYTFGEQVVTIDENTTISSRLNGEIYRVAITTEETPECQHSYYEGFCTKCLSENDETQTVQVGDSVLGKSFRLNSGESITLMGDNGETIVFAAMGSSFVCIVDGDYSTPGDSICSKNNIVIEGPPNDYIVVFHACAGLAIGSKGSTITIDENTTISAVEGDVDWLAREVSAEE